MQHGVPQGAGLGTNELDNAVGLPSLLMNPLNEPLQSGGIV